MCVCVSGDCHQCVCVCVCVYGGGSQFSVFSMSSVTSRPSPHYAPLPVNQEPRNASYLQQQHWSSHFWEWLSRPEKNRAKKQNDKKIPQSIGKCDVCEQCWECLTRRIFHIPYHGTFPGENAWGWGAAFTSLPSLLLMRPKWSQVASVEWNFFFLKRNATVNALCKIPHCTPFGKHPIYLTRC